MFGIEVVWNPRHGDQDPKKDIRVVVSSELFSYVLGSHWMQGYDILSNKTGGLNWVNVS